MSVARRSRPAPSASTIGSDDPRIEVGPVLPTNSNEIADVVLDSLAAGR